MAKDMREKTFQRVSINILHEKLVDDLYRLGKRDLSILDIGGAASYRPTMREKQWWPVSRVMKVLDIDPTYEPNYVADATEPLDFPDNSWDVVLCGQLLEHTFNFAAVIGELYRITRGICVIDVPFVYKYHCHPHDYWRFSPEAMQRLCFMAGFPMVGAEFVCNKTMTWCIAVKDTAEFDLASLSSGGEHEGGDDDGA